MRLHTSTKDYNIQSPCMDSSKCGRQEFIHHCWHWRKPSSHLYCQIPNMAGGAGALVSVTRIPAVLSFDGKHGCACLIFLEKNYDSVKTYE